MKYFALFSVALTLVSSSSFKLSPSVRLLEKSVDDNNVTLAMRALESGAAVDAPITNTGLTPLMLATELGRTEMIEFLVSKGASLLATDSFGYTALHFATNPSGSLEGLKAVLKLESSNINSVENEQKNTPLHFAAANGNVAKIKALLDAGADMKAINNIGNTPLLSACYKDNVDAVALLISCGGDYLDLNNTGADCLAIAAKSNCLGVAAMLLNKINPTKLNNNTGIIRAVLHNSQTPEMMELLAEYSPFTISYIQPDTRPVSASNSNDSSSN